MTNWNKFFRILWKKKIIVLLIPVLLSLISAYVSLDIMQPKYEASTKLFVLYNSHGGDPHMMTYDDLLASQILATNYKEVIKSNSVTSEVIRRLHLQETNEEIADSIDVTVIPDSSSIRISVRHRDAYLVGKIANEVSSVFVLKASELLGINNITIVDKAVVSEKPVYPNPILLISLSFLAGAVLSFSFVLFIAFIDDAVGNTEEIEKKTGLPVVGIIPNMKIK
ncbi:YveK family protein [Dehalobacter sp. TBBPA1]|uniref:YveK family protein n=1 Tax=Dehalobacter sp. TBBPA1 TaxID=3235037 RepID=UPI0034A12636